MTPGKKPNQQGYRPHWEIDEEGRPIPQEHHIVPKSRGGEHSFENILDDVPSDTHWAWHKLFGNLKPIEIIIIVLKYFFRGGRFHKGYQRIVNKRQSPAPYMPPDEIIVTLIERAFPEGWVPSEESIEYLQERRRSGSQS